MDEKELMGMFQTKPKEALDYLEKHGVNFFEAGRKLDLGRLFVKKRFGMSKNSIDATEFVFWISYYAERELRDIISSIEKTLSGISTPMIEGMIDRLHFGDKISLVEKHYAGKSSEYLIKILWKINNLRNNVAHGRFDELVYEDLALSDAKGQLLLISDFMNALLKKS